MYTKNTDENIESLVMPLFEVVVYPKSRAKFLADKVTGELLSTEIKNAEPVYAVGLTVKSGITMLSLLSSVCSEYIVNRLIFIKLFSQLSRSFQLFSLN